MGANLLIVEDSIAQAKMIQTILIAEGHNVVLSNDGVGVPELIIDNQIDIALIDIILPGVDGFELLEEITLTNETKDTPVIMVTCLTSGFDLKKALDMGAFDYIKKPIDRLELIARVHSALRLKSKQDQLKEYAAKDRLTGMLNRAYFDEILTRIVKDTDSYESGLCVAMLDCDYFKNINDTYGHVAGDRVLYAVAKAIKKSLRSTDIACRYGGEEFCFALLNANLLQGFGICERIRKNIASLHFCIDDMEISVTVSIGVTHLPGGGAASPLQLISEADQAMYTAKANGRNRVEMANITKGN